jgi:ABC-type branched-subunit amino acid transport system ATPase component
MAELRFRGLAKSFDGVCALVEVSAQLPSGGIIAIVGPNGAGKTTLLNILTGFIRPDAGECSLDDHDITGLAPHRIARLGIARTFQDLRLMQQASVIENVMLARPKQRGESLLGALFRVGVGAEEGTNRLAATRLLRFVGLADKADDLAGELSYGEQKLLTLACCLATEARILLLDEPVAGVHPELAGKILGLLQQLRSDDRLIVFIDHDLAAVRRVADRVIVMDEGRIIADGPPAEVLERPDIMEAYVA